MTKWIIIASATLLAPFSLAQTQNKPAVFEVASIKKAEPHHLGQTVGPYGGPGTTNPGTYSCFRCSVMHLLYGAYGVNPNLIKVHYSTDDLFDVVAKIPANTSKEQFREMLRSLLAERFKLRAHTEKRETRVFVLQKDSHGSRLQESADEPYSGPPKWDKDGSFNHQAAMDVIRGQKMAACALLTITRRCSGSAMCFPHG